MKSRSRLSFLKNTIILLAFTVSAGAVEPRAPSRQWSVEIDPATFIFHGFSGHIRVQPESSRHFLVGGGIYAMDMPSFLVDLNADNKNEGWDVRLNLGLGIFGEYYFPEVNRKWFAGTQAGIQEYRIGNLHLDGTARFTSALLMAYGGYTFRPFDFPLYFKPWAGIGITSKLSGESILEGESYVVAPVTAFMTLHIGYTF